MKYEIAREFGVTLGPDTPSRLNGSVGGEITKRLVQLGQQIEATKIVKKKKKLISSFLFTNFICKNVIYYICFNFVTFY